MDIKFKNKIWFKYSMSPLPHRAHEALTQSITWVSCGRLSTLDSGLDTAHIYSNYDVVKQKESHIKVDRAVHIEK